MERTNGLFAAKLKELEMCIRDRSESAAAVNCDEGPANESIHLYACRSVPTRYCPEQRSGGPGDGSNSAGASSTGL